MPTLTFKSAKALDKSFIPSKLDSTAIDFLSLFGVVDNSIGMNVVNIIRY